MHRTTLKTLIASIVLSLLMASAGCGRTNSGAITTGDAPSDDGWDGGSGAGEDSFPPNPLPDLKDLEEGMEEVEETLTDPEQKQAAEAAQIAIRAYQDFYGGMKNYDSSKTAILIQLLKLAMARAKAAADKLEAAKLEALAVIYEQMANMIPVFQVTDNKIIPRFYYVSDLNQVESLKSKLGDRFQLDGIAFPLWKVTKPSTHPKINIPTVPLYGCDLKFGGTFLTPDKNCEGNSKVNQGTAKVLGYASATPAFPELTLRRYRLKLFSDRYTVTMRDKVYTRINPKFWVYDRALGGAAQPIGLNQGGPQY